MRYGCAHRRSHLLHPCLSQKQLKSKLRAHGLPQSGQKAQLIDRLMTADQESEREREVELTVGECVARDWLVWQRGSKRAHARGGRLSWFGAIFAPVRVAVFGGG